MKKIIILIPVFNDWDSLSKLILETSSKISVLNEYQFEYIIVNDGSTIPQPKIIVPKNIIKAKIINMKTNKGHATCIAYGINYVKQNEKFDKLILMDGDGEDRPEEIIDLIKRNIASDNESVVAKRVKRSEGFFFQILYKLHKLITLVFTGHKINFGNFTLLTKKDLYLISEKASLWKSYSATFKKYIKSYAEIDSIRGKRYFGPSKMSIFKLLFHSFSIIATFKYNVFLRSTFIFIILAYLSIYMTKILILSQILLIFFNLLIFLISIKKIDIEKKLKNVDGIEELSH